MQGCPIYQHLWISLQGLCRLQKGAKISNANGNLHIQQADHKSYFSQIWIAVERTLNGDGRTQTVKCLETMADQLVEYCARLIERLLLLEELAVLKKIKESQIEQKKFAADRFILKELTDLTRQAAQCLEQLAAAYDDASDDTAVRIRAQIRKMTCQVQENALFLGEQGAVPEKKASLEAKEED
jgi:hypothetical protein